MIKSENENRQMQLMLAPAVERLKKYSAPELCGKAKIDFDEASQEFVIDSMGRKIHVHYPDFEVREELEMWHHLTILQYMDTADGSSLSGKWIGLTEMPGGLARGRGYDTDIATMFAHDFSEVSCEEFEAACVKIGGTIQKSKADVTAVIPYAPQFPVCVNFYEGDDEFKAQGKLLVDKNADHYLTIEAAGGACSAVVAAIRRAVRGEESDI